MKGFLLLWLALVCFLPCILTKEHHDDVGLNTRDDEPVQGNVPARSDTGRSEIVDGDDKILEAEGRGLVDVPKRIQIKRGWIWKCIVKPIYDYVKGYYKKKKCSWLGCWWSNIVNWVRKIVRYVYSCGWAYIRGDPHYATLDGYVYEFQGTCAYVLAQSPCGVGVTPEFRILSENYYASDAQRTNKVSSPKNVILQAYGHTLVFNHDRRIIVDGMERRLPLMIGDENADYISAHTDTNRIIITTDKGIVITVYGLDSIGLSIPIAYEGKLCGLLGNYDKVKTNDLMLPDLTQAPDVFTFANSWKDDDLSNPRCDDGQQLSTDACDTPAKKAKAEKECGGIDKANGAFKKCHSLVPASVFKTDCVYDMCGDPGDLDFLCNAYEMYAAACAEVGVLVNWRQGMGQCQAKCMKHGNYEIKTSPCLNSCIMPDAEDTCDITLPSVQGCKCTGKRLYDNGQCLEPTECGCTNDAGYYHQQGDFWYESDCTKACRCEGVNNIKCSDVTECHDDLTCVAQPDGSKDCRCQAGDPCAKRCNVAADGTLSSPLAIGYNLPAQTKQVIARTDKEGSDPCKAQVMVSTDKVGNVAGAVVSVGVKGGNYARKYSFDENVFVSGAGVKGKKKFPFGDFNDGSVSVSVSKESSGHKMVVECGNDHLFTFTYNESEVKHVHLVVEDEHIFNALCFDY